MADVEGGDLASPLLIFKKMNESVKLKLQAVISRFASERDMAHAQILKLLNKGSMPELMKQFLILARAEKNIETVQLFFAKQENLDKIKNTDKSDNPS